MKTTEPKPDQPEPNIFQLANWAAEFTGIPYPRSIYSPEAYLKHVITVQKTTLKAWQDGWNHLAQTLPLPTV